ncbi:MAG: hypothetical protein II016_01545 [Erysipelotrichaceae bacterium]|nr:hypothetical protein [Erysipelotrichaceae bacterium]
MRKILLLVLLLLLCGCAEAQTPPPEPEPRVTPAVVVVKKHHYIAKAAEAEAFSCTAGDEIDYMSLLDYNERDLIGATVLMTGDGLSTENPGTFSVIIAVVDEDGCFSQIEKEIVVKKKYVRPSYTPPVSAWDGAPLTKSAGVINGPSGKESYYNLNMSGVIAIAKNAGIEGDYWIREDGVKMYGSYIMCACDDTGTAHSRFDIVQTSLGTGICLDTGSFKYENPWQIDIAVDW